MLLYVDVIIVMLKEAFKPGPSSQVLRAEVLIWELIWEVCKS